MKVRAQIAMVLNPDKCIGCHNCSVTCKQVWASRKGVEYAWFSNVKTKPGIGYPKEWENQDRWKGGWTRKHNGALRPRIGAKYRNFQGIQKEIYGAFEKTSMFYLPRLCEHCFNPACVAASPSGSTYKREEDGIVLVDQDKCRGWLHVRLRLPEQ